MIITVRMRGKTIRRKRCGQLRPEHHRGLELILRHSQDAGEQDQEIPAASIATRQQR